MSDHIRPTYLRISGVIHVDLQAAVKVDLHHRDSNFDPILIRVVHYFTNAMNLMVCNEIAE